MWFSTHNARYTELSDWRYDHQRNSVELVVLVRSNTESTFAKHNLQEQRHPSSTLRSKATAMDANGTGPKE
jgi:hypothetical protein